YGYAERHWGLARSDGTVKPAQAVWVKMVKDARAGASPSPSPFTPTFEVSPNVNGWWVEVDVRDGTPTKVQVSVDGAAWVDLPKTSWGAYAKSLRVPAGSSVRFRATDAYGSEAVSPAVRWLSFSARFEPSPNRNAWWVETAVRADVAVQRVETRANGGTWFPIEKTSWGSWGKGVSVGPKAKVEFRAYDARGYVATSPVFVWP
ncbi:MAG: hypothetical protein ACT4PT_04010, partial [Methanobacteriota archaeon]